MFSSQKQQCRAIILLLQSLGLGHIWTDEGPSKLAIDWIENGSPLSSGEAILVRAAFDFWNGEGKVTIHEIMKLDGRRTELICTLMASVNQSGDMVEAWIRYQENRAPERSADQMTNEELLNTLGFDPKKWRVRRV